jgi:hypothetical protein
MVMRWTWAAPILLVVLALVGGRALHLRHWVHHAEADHVHSHAHWQGDERHEHHHGHDEAVTESLDDHAQQPHEHGWTNAPNEESNPTTLIVAPARRDQWTPNQPFVAVSPMMVHAPSALDKPPSTPPPRSRAGPKWSQLAALRSIVLQV